MNRHWELRKLAYEFAYVVDPRDFLDHWEQHGELLHDCRMVFSDPRLSKSPFPGGLAARTFGQDPKTYLNSFFDGPGIFCLTNELVRTHRSGRTASPMLDWSVALDSNFVGDIHKFMTGKSLEARWPAFLEAATYIRTNKLNLDALPYLFENFEKARRDLKHLDFVVNGFATFYRFTTGRLLSEAPSGLSDFEFAMSETEAHSHAKKAVAGMLNDPAMMEEGVRRQWHRQDTHLALLLTAIEYYGQRHSSVKDKTLWLMHALEKYVKRIPDREFLFAFRAFANPKEDPFFANQWPIPYNRKQNIVDLIRNMAWDISFYRTMQTWASKKDAGDFAIPYFLTSDWKLAGLNGVYTCRILLIDDRDRNIYCLPPSSLQQMLEDSGCWEDLKLFFAPERIEARMSGQVPYDMLASRCREAEQELHQLVYGAAMAR